MARNTQVAADDNAPPITQILAEFVAPHPGYLAGGWSAAANHETHRIFMNWLDRPTGFALRAAETPRRRWSGKPLEGPLEK